MPDFLTNGLELAELNNVIETTFDVLMFLNGLLLLTRKVLMIVSHVW